MLVHYQSHLFSKEIIPEDTDTFRLNSIRSKDWRSFVNLTYSIALISSTGYITAKPHTNTGLVDKFKVTYSPDDSFK